MWKDDAISEHISEIASLIMEGAGEPYRNIEFAGMVIPGVTGVKMRVVQIDGSKKSPSNGRSITPIVEAHLKEFHRIFKENGENWKAMLLVVRPDGDFDLNFEYDDPYRFAI
jgi:hypothetical protein